MNRKIIWKFNIIDLLIMAIVLLSIFALFYRMVAGGGEDERIYTITYMCEEAPLELLYNIRGNDSCAGGDARTELGTVTGISITEIADSPYGSAEIRSEVEAFKSDHGIIIDDNVYLKGMPLSLIVGDSIFNVYIKNIE